jgi:hypothetical protein
LHYSYYAFPHYFASYFANDETDEELEQELENGMKNEHCLFVTFEVGVGEMN